MNRLIEIANNNSYKLWSKEALLYMTFYYTKVVIPAGILSLSKQENAYFKIINMQSKDYCDNYNLNLKHEQVNLDPKARRIGEYLIACHKDDHKKYITMWDGLNTFESFCEYYHKYLVQLWTHELYKYRLDDLAHFKGYESILEDHCIHLTKDENYIYTHGYYEGLYEAFMDEYGKDITEYRL